MTRSDILIEVGQYHRGELSKEKTAELINAMSRKIENVYGFVINLEKNSEQQSSPFVMIATLAKVLRKQLEP